MTRHLNIPRIKYVKYGDNYQFTIHDGGSVGAPSNSCIYIENGKLLLKLPRNGNRGPRIPNINNNYNYYENLDGFIINLTQAGGSIEFQLSNGLNSNYNLETDVVNNTNKRLVLKRKPDGNFFMEGLNFYTPNYTPVIEICMPTVELSATNTTHYFQSADMTYGDPIYNQLVLLGIDTHARNSRLFSSRQP